MYSSEESQQSDLCLRHVEMWVPQRLSVVSAGLIYSATTPALADSPECMVKYAIRELTQHRLAATWWRVL